MSPAFVGWSAGRRAWRRGGGSAGRGRRRGERHEGLACERGEARGHHPLARDGEQLLADHERAIDLWTRAVDRVVDDPPDFRDAGVSDAKSDRSDKPTAGFRGRPLAATGSGGGQGSTAEPSGGFVGAIGFRVDHSGITEVGRIVHDPVNGTSPQIDRSLVIGQQLFTVSSEGVMASSLATLARQTFVTFPSPPPAAGGASSPPPGAPSG